MRKHDSIRDKLSRRQYAQLAAMAGAGSLAGCPEQGGTGTGTPTDDGTQGSPSETSDAGTPEGDPVTDTIRFVINNNPSEFDKNPWTPGGSTTGDYYMSELHALSNVNNREILYSGHTVDAPWVHGHDEISIATLWEDYEVEAPYDIWESIDDRMEFWNGDPYDAQAVVDHQHVLWFHDGNKFQEGATFDWEVADDFRVHRWNAKGNVENQEANPQNANILSADAGSADGERHLPSAFTQPYVEEYENASTEEAQSEVHSTLEGDRISLERMAEEGWGSGLYEISSTDDISSERTTLTIRDGNQAGSDYEHPNAEHANIPNFQIRWANDDRETVLVNNGQVDLARNAVSPNGRWNRDSLPDHMQELTRYLRHTGSDIWQFNWNNQHIQNLWFRRAIVTAVDWNAVGQNGWGPERSIPQEYDTFLQNTLNEQTFSEEFLDSLHKYPSEADYELAEEYLQNGGYTKQGGTWVGPDGNEASFALSNRSPCGDCLGGAQTIKAHLDEIGVPVEFNNVPNSTWQNSLKPENMNFDTTLMWHGDNYAFNSYRTRGAWYDEPIIAGDPNSESMVEADPESAGDDYDTVDTKNMPLQVDIPTEVGSIEAPDEAGRKPSLENGEEFDAITAAHRLREPDVDDEEYQEILRKFARFYNFYLPHYTFHQYTWGQLGNVRDFDWPPRDHEGLDLERSFDATDALILGGIAQASHNTDYEAP